MIAMTGEMTLNGKILKVGGLKEKIILAMESGINKVYVPLDNQRDILEFESIYKDKLEIVLVDNYKEIYQDLFEKTK